MGRMLIWQHPAHLTKVHASRYVNNLYLDTLPKTFYADHVDSNTCPPLTGEMVANLQPALINRYLRQYFETRTGRVRVTIDTEMSFYHANRFGTGVRFGYADHAVIVEIKFDECAIAEGTAVAAHFPLPLNKNSKYVNGIRLLHGRC